MDIYGGFPHVVVFFDDGLKNAIVFGLGIALTFPSPVSVDSSFVSAHIRYVFFPVSFEPTTLALP